VAAFARLDELRARKRELLVESELNRQALAVDVDHLRMRCAEYQRVHGALLEGWRMAAPVAGLLFARKAGSGWFAKASALGALGWKLWKTWRGEKSG
jgi:hypothetical protein